MKSAPLKLVQSSARALRIITLLVWLPFIASMSADVQLLLPLNRTAYQCNEWIDVSMARDAADALPSGELALNINGNDGSKLSFVFPVGQVDATAGRARSVEHLRVNGWLLRPGSYNVEVACDGATARTNIEVFSHIRRSDFKLVNWGRAQGKEQLPQGGDNLGFNLFYGHYSANEEANFIRAGVDFMACCVMGGGHQMDLRQECDWSDPYVIRGGARRAVQRAFMDRTRPNVWGVHFYDEPGLTWVKNPETGEMTPHAVPWQLRQYEAAFGEQMLSYRTLNPASPDDAARWAQWARWKLGFMDAAWKDAQFGVGRVRPDYVSVSAQSSPGHQRSAG